jgi:hypothetical protein
MVFLLGTTYRLGLACSIGGLTQQMAYDGIAPERLVARIQGREGRSPGWRTEQLNRLSIRINTPLISLMPEMFCNSRDRPQCNRTVAAVATRGHHPIYHCHRLPHVNHRRTLAGPKNDDSTNRMKAAPTRMASVPSMPSTNQLIRWLIGTASDIRCQAKSQISSTQLWLAHAP